MPFFNWMDDSQLKAHVCGDFEIVEAPTDEEDIILVILIHGDKMT